MRTTLTFPLGPGKTTWIQPKGQCPRGLPGSTIRTTSPGAMLHFSSTHLFRVFRVDRFSFINFLQHLVTGSCVNRDLFRWLNVRSSMTVGASCPPINLRRGMLTDLICVTLALAVSERLRSVHSHVRIWCSLLRHRLHVIVARQRVYKARRLPLLPCGVDSKHGILICGASGNYLAHWWVVNLKSLGNSSSHSRPCNQASCNAIFALMMYGAKNCNGSNSVAIRLNRPRFM